MDYLLRHPELNDGTALFPFLLAPPKSWNYVSQVQNTNFYTMTPPDGYLALSSWINFKNSGPNASTPALFIKNLPHIVSPVSSYQKYFDATMAFDPNANVSVWSGVAADPDYICMGNIVAAGNNGPPDGTVYAIHKSLLRDSGIARRAFFYVDLYETGGRMLIYVTTDPSINITMKITNPAVNGGNFDDGIANEFSIVTYDDAVACMKNPTSSSCLNLWQYYKAPECINLPDVNYTPQLVRCYDNVCAGARYSGTAPHCPDANNKLYQPMTGEDYISLSDDQQARLLGSDVIDYKWNVNQGAQSGYFQNYGPTQTYLEALPMSNTQANFIKLNWKAISYPLNINFQSISIDGPEPANSNVFVSMLSRNEVMIGTYEEWSNGKVRVEQVIDDCNFVSNCAGCLWIVFNQVDYTTQQKVDIPPCIMVDNGSFSIQPQLMAKTDGTYPFSTTRRYRMSVNQPIGEMYVATEQEMVCWGAIDSLGKLSAACDSIMYSECQKYKKHPRCACINAYSADGKQPDNYVLACLNKCAVNNPSVYIPTNVFDVKCNINECAALGELIANGNINVNDVVINCNFNGDGGMAEELIALAMFFIVLLIAILLVYQYYTNNYVDRKVNAPLIPRQV